MKESTLVNKVLKKIAGEPSIVFCCEVPILGRVADIVYIQDDCVYSIEFKIKDWKKAIRQARDHSLGSDYSYICMPRRKVSEALRRELNDYGIGLLFYDENGDWPFEIVIDAQPSHETSATARNWTVEYIQQSSRRE